jgi:hypothetical protein
MEQADTDADLEDSGVDDVDEHAASGQPDTMAFCDQYVCYSATFQVPIFYFNLFELGMYTTKINMCRPHIGY